MTGHRAPRLFRLAAATWAALFAAAHAAWALGSCTGLGPECEDGMSPAFLVYDVVAGVLCLVAVALLRDVARHRRLLTVGAVLLLARGGVGLLQDLARLDDLPATWVFDPFFLLGGVLFAGAVRAADRSTASAPAPSARDRPLSPQ